MTLPTLSSTKPWFTTLNGRHGRKTQTPAWVHQCCSCRVKFFTPSFKPKKCYSLQYPLLQGDAFSAIISLTIYRTLTKCFHYRLLTNNSLTLSTRNQFINGKGLLHKRLVIIWWLPSTETSIITNARALPFANNQHCLDVINFKMRPVDACQRFVNFDML